jgi:adenosylmethionine-8-amino-7-oxononanoate aminotransferase
VFEENNDTFGTIGHGYTYSGHPVGCAAGIATLAETKRLQLDKNAAARGVELFAALKKMHRQHEIVGDVRAKGLMACIELVGDRTKKTPLDKARMAKIAEGAYEAGVTIRVSGANIILSPPLIVTAADIATIANGIDRGLAAAG